MKDLFMISHIKKIAMKNIFKITIVFLFISVSYTSRCQTMTAGTWRIKSSKVDWNGNSSYLYKVNKKGNLFDLSKISYRFFDNDTYNGISVDGTDFVGKWQRNLSQIIIDSVSSNIELTDSGFVISYDFKLLDSLGNLYPAKSILTFENYPDNFILSVSPNPFSNSITINMQNSKDFEASFGLYDILGRFVYREPNRKFYAKDYLIINTTALSRGVYLLTVYSKDVKNEPVTIVKY